MMTATISDFRKDIKSYFNKVIDNFEPLIINRGKDSLVVISLEEYNSLNSTQHELSSEANVKRLNDSIEEFKNGDSIIKELIEE
jgi:antitoxin YefM